MENNNGENIVETIDKTAFQLANPLARLLACNWPIQKSCFVASSESPLFFARKIIITVLGNDVSVDVDK